MLGQADARQVDVHTATILIRPEKLGFQIRVLRMQAAVVVGVDDTYITLTGIDCLNQRGVVGKHVCSKVIDPTLDDFFGLLGAMGFDQGSGQGLVINLLAGPQAQTAFPILVGQGFVGRQLTLFNTLG